MQGLLYIHSISTIYLLAIIRSLHGTDLDRAERRDSDGSNRGPCWKCNLHPEQGQMDRAEKLKKYGKKRRRQSRQAYGSSVRRGSRRKAVRLAGAAFASACLAGLLLLLLHQKKDGADFLYVTKGELASCMSFLSEEILPDGWEKEADTYVTQAEMKELIRNVGLAGMIPAPGGKERLERQAVMEYYEQMLDYLDLEDAVQKETILVLSHSGKTCQTQEKTLQAGAVPKLQEFHTYGVYLLEDRMLGVKAESEKTIALRQAQFESLSDDSITVTFQTKKYHIPCKDQQGMEGLKRAGSGASCVLCVKGGVVTKIKEIKAGSGSLNQKESRAQTPSEYVKVLLLNKGEIHYDQLYFTSDDAWNVRQTVKKKEKKTAYQPSDILSVKKLKLSKEGSAVIASSGENGKLYLADADGNRISKGYYGSLTVYRDTQGYYLVNHVKIEKYLYSVVASEMPAAFGVEALKAQAVCARSYVCRQMAAEDYGQYHAQIDDSTNYQVYNKSEVVDADIEAVEATAGEVMYAQNEIVNAYYFSSSFGYTSSMEIWGQEEAAYPYLKMKSMNPSQKDRNQTPDLSEEKDFQAYISDRDAPAFDSHSRYFRWDAKVELSAAVKELKDKIKERQGVNPDHFTFYYTAKKKAKKVSSLKGFGGVKKMYCSKRGRSGAILVLTIQFEFGKVEIKSEYNIRAIVGCAMEQITYADGTSDTGSRFLPSAYFTISFDKKSRRYLLRGGGNGHGMGMSQYGAAGMAQEGWNYKEILTYFYDGVKVKKMTEPS